MGAASWLVFNSDMPVSPPLNPYCLGVTSVIARAIHGTAWSGAEESGHPMAITSAARVQNMYQWCTGQGFGCGIHTVPHGEAAGIATESSLTITALGALVEMGGNELWIDYEESPGGTEFWTVETSPGSGVTDRTKIATYMTPIRAAFPTARIGVTVDPNNAALVAYWTPWVDMFAHTAYQEEGKETTAQIDYIWTGWRANCPTKEMHVLLETNGTDTTRTATVAAHARAQSLVVDTWRLEISTAAFWAGIRAAT